MAMKKTTSAKKTGGEKTEDAKEALDQKKAKKKASTDAVDKSKKSKKSVSDKTKKKTAEEEHDSGEPKKLRPFVTAPKVTPPPQAAPPPPPPPPPAPPVVKAPTVVPKIAKPTPPPEKKAHDGEKPKKPVRRETIEPPVPSPRHPSPTPAAIATAAPPAVSAPVRKKIRFNEMMTVNDLANAMEVKVADAIKKLLTLGTPASINQRLHKDAATLVADAFGFELEFKSIYVDEAAETSEPETDLKPRSPVVTVMGHVDHGKTSLLDAIRSARVVEKEAGGITQHIGAYQVRSPRGTITFLDTPGHEAFTAMRARGTTVTDLVILVVAAEDSVMPQTVEAIDHARAANVPIVVAINKVDLPTANVQRVKQELAQHNLVAEDWGGKTVMVEVSAKTRLNIEKLIEMILLEAELLELKANPNRPARGVVLEARLDPKRGVTATMLVQAGTLKVGDVIVCGLSYGRVRAMIDEYRAPLESAGPSSPAEILGLNQVPQVGDQFTVVSNEREAREIIERRQTMLKESEKVKSGHLSLESLHSKIAEGKIQDLPIILKADVQGSMQAIQDSLGKISGSSIQLRFVHTGVGNVNESDVLLAEAADAIVFGFNVKVETSAEVEAKRGGVDIRCYQIIYEMLADIRAAMEGLLKPEEREVVKGRLTVKQLFPSSRHNLVLGAMVLEGKVNRGGKIRVLREGQLIGTGTVSGLRRFKEDVREVEKGYECGLLIEGVKSVQAGDLVETFVIEKHARRLEG